MPFICVLDVGAVTNHLSRHHHDLWLGYTLQRDAKKNAEAAKKKEDRANSEMENPDMRFIAINGNTNKRKIIIYVLTFGGTKNAAITNPSNIRKDKFILQISGFGYNP